MFYQKERTHDFSKTSVEKTVNLQNKIRGWIGWSGEKVITILKLFLFSWKLIRFCPSFKRSLTKVMYPDDFKFPLKKTISPYI